METETDAHLRLAAQDSFETFCQCCKEEQISFSWVDKIDYYWNAYLLSTSRTDKVLREEALPEENRGILWKNNSETVIPKSEDGKDKRIIVDFGDAYVGSFEFLIKAGAGTVLDIYCYENEYGGEIDYTIGLNNGMRYICTDGWQQYCGMVRMGARYAMLTIRNAVEDVRIRDFHLKTRTFASAREGDFSCSDELLNRIYKMCVHTHELCLEDTVADCPTYEQAFWLGDAKMTEKVNMYVSGDYSLIKRNLLFGATAENNTKLFNALTPTDWNTSIPMWMMNWILAVEEYWDVTEDDGVVLELYENIKGVLDYYRGFITEEGAFLIYAWNMMDWADMDIDNYGVVTGQQAILAYCYRIAGNYAQWMGEEEKSVEYQDIAKKLLKYIDRELWDEAGQRYLDGWTPKGGLSKTSSIQTHVLLYFYDGIWGEEKRKITEKYLINPPEDFVKAGSPFMLYYVHECLAKFGRTNQVLEKIKEKWGEMLRYDSTTCWEVFPGFYENSRTRSYCQSWSAAPVVFLTEEVLGIKRIGRGFHQVKLSVSSDAVSWCKGAMPTPYGAIRVQWDRKTGEYRIWIPKEIEADTKDLGDWKVTVTVV